MEKRERIPTSVGRTIYMLSSFFDGIKILLFFVSILGIVVSASLNIIPVVGQVGSIAVGYALTIAGFAMTQTVGFVSFVCFTFLYSRHGVKFTDKAVGARLALGFFFSFLPASTTFSNWLIISSVRAADAEYNKQVVPEAPPAPRQFVPPPRMPNI